MITVKLKKEYISLFAVIGCSLLIFIYPDIVKKGITNGLIICFNSIIPSLFPFMVISSYIIKADILSPVYRLTSPLTRFLFRQPECVTPVIFLSMIGGFPIGLKMVSALYDSGKITEKQAERLSFFCMNAGPSFVITVLGVNLFKSAKAGIIIYSSLCLSSVLLGILSRFLDSGEKEEGKNIKKQLSPSSLASSVSDGLQGILNICAWIVLFSALTSFTDPLPLNKNLNSVFTCFLEISNGCISSVGVLPLPFFAFFMGFGGICVHCQILGYIKNCKIRYGKFFIFRIINGILSAVITYILLIFFPVEINVFTSISEIVPVSFSVSLPTFIMLVVMCVIMIFDIDRKRKVC